MKPSMAISGRMVGADTPCYIIAEVGVNHNGDVSFAHALIDVAARAGADAVKFQTFDPASVVSPRGITAPYQREQTGHVTQRNMLHSLTLPRKSWAELRDHAIEAQLHFLSTPFDVDSAELLCDLGVPALKLGSGELTNSPFISQLAEFGLPLLVSTGMATLEEVAAAVEAANHAPALALFHCVSAYPTRPADSNLKAIETLERGFVLPVGWSDHTKGSLTAIAAVALGARLLEKHVTLDESMEGPDHAASESPSSFEEYVYSVRIAEAACGDGKKQPQPSELSNRESARRSWHATRRLSPGEVLASSDIVALRPATALSPSLDITGRSMKRSVEAGAPIVEDDLESG